MAAAFTQAQLDAINTLNEVMAQDTNGDDVYSNERAMLGYIKEHEKLVVVAGNTGRAPIALNVKELGTQDAINTHLGPGGDAWRAANPYLPVPRFTNVQLIKLAVLNAKPLIEAPAGEALSVERATLIGLLRARWLLLGCLYPTIRERCTTFNEVLEVAPDSPIWNVNTIADLHAINDPTVTAVLTFLSTAAGKELARWVTNNAELVWAMSEHLMRSRGHHYKADYDHMIDRMYASSSSGNVPWPANINRCDALRTSIHPFGVKALPVMTYFFAWHGKLGTGMLKRITGASNGYSAATTAYAGIGMVSSEVWFQKWLAMFGDAAAMITAFAKEMLEDRYSFHESASLYGVAPRRSIIVEGKTYTMVDVDTAVNAIAPALQGFIEWSTKQANAGQGAVFAFANAKVLAKRSANNPMMVKRISSLLDALMTHIEDAETSADSINEAFPAIKDVAENP